MLDNEDDSEKFAYPPHETPPVSAAEHASVTGYTIDIPAWRPTSHADAWVWALVGASTLLVIEAVTAAAAAIVGWVLL